MELSNLLNAMVQGAESDALAKIQSRGQSGGANAVAQAGANAGGQPGVAAPTGQVNLTLAAQPPALKATGQPGIGGQASAGGLAATLSAGQPFGAGQPSPGVPGQTSPGAQVGSGRPPVPPGVGQPLGFTLGGQTGLGVSPAGSGPALPHGPAAGQASRSPLPGRPGSNPGPSGQLSSSVGTQPPTALTPSPQSGLPELLARATPSGLGADTNYGAAAPASPSLLSHSGVGAYIQLLNALSTHEANDRTANLVTNNLGTASATLKSAYFQAVSALPSDLQQKDWGFSISNATLVFTQGKVSLTAQD